MRKRPARLGLVQQPVLINRELFRLAQNDRTLDSHILSHQHCNRTLLGPETSGLSERVGTEKVAKPLVLQEKRLVRAMHYQFTRGWPVQPNI